MHDQLTYADNWGEIVFGVVYDPHFSDIAPESRKDDYITALFDKMTHVEKDLEANGGRFLLIPGDILHKRAVSMKFLCRLVQFIRNYKFPVYGISGNHELYAGNVSMLDRTSMGVLFASGVIRRLTHLGVTAGDLSIHLRGFDFEPAFHCETPAMDDYVEGWADEEGSFYDPSAHDEFHFDHHMAVAHGFVKKTHAAFTSHDYVNVPSFRDAGYGTLFLGHDHTIYEPEDAGGILVCRGGSLSRGTKHKYNRERGIQYHLVRVTKEGVKVEARQIPCDPAESVYSEQQIEREDQERVLKKLIMKFKETQTEQATREDDIFSIIDKMEAPSQETKDLCFKYLQEGGIVREDFA